MENFKIESRYLKLCYVFRAFIRCMEAAFSRTDYEKILGVSVDQKTLSSICFKTCDQPFKCPAKLLKHLVELLKV